MSVKIVHCGDIHIGKTGNDKTYTQKRSREVFQTFFKTLDFAAKNQADLFLIAGDLFDNHKIDQDALDIICRSFEAFGNDILICPGNHDYYGSNTFWETAAFPSNVTVFKSDGDVFENAEKGVRVYGSPFQEAYKEAVNIPKVDFNDNFINIALLHGDISKNSPYGFISEEDIKNSNFDYIALGHIHKRSDIIKKGNTSYAYCGCIEGQGFDETGEKGIYFGTVDKGNADLDFIPLCSRRFIEEEINISSIDNKNDIPQFILRKINEKYGDAGTDWLYKIILTGETNCFISSDVIKTVLDTALYYTKIINKTTLPTEDILALAKENTVKGFFVRNITEKADENGDEDLKTALRLGLTAFSQEVGFDED